MGEEQCVESVICGWKAIAKVFGISVRSAQRRRKELFDAGVVFYMLRGRAKRRHVCAFPSLLRAWAAVKSRKGERI